MRPNPIFPFLGGIASMVAAAEAAFSAALTRQPPPRFPVASGGNAAPAVFVPKIVLPPIQIGPAETDQPQALRLTPVRLDLQPVQEPVPPPPTAEDVRKAVFQDGKRLDELSKQYGMSEQQLLDLLGQSSGVTVKTATSNVGTQITITDARTGTTVTIVHDYEKGSDSTTVKKADGSESSWMVDGNGVTTHSTFDPKTGVHKTHIEDPKAGTVTDITAPKDGPTRIVITGPDGKKTVKIVGDDFTTTTGPDGKVTVTDHKTGAEITLENLTYAEALRRDDKLAGDIDTATKNHKSLEKKLAEAGLTPEMLANPDPSKFNLNQAKLYKEYLESQAGLNKLLLERRILVGQYTVSVAKPGTKEYNQAVNDLLDSVYLQDRVIANDNANIKVADKAITLIQANGKLAPYDLFDDAVLALKADPDNDYLFNPDGYVNGNHEGTGKLLSQEVIYKDGHIWLRNVYENHIFADDSNVLEIKLTWDPGSGRYRSDAQQQVDQKWHDARAPFTRMCTREDTGWQDAKDQQATALSEYQAAVGDRASTQKFDVDATIPDLKKIHDDAVAKYGPGTTEKPTGTPEGGGEWVQIQQDGKLLWVHPEVAASYLALKLAQEEAASLDAQIQDADKNVDWLKIKRDNPGRFLDSVLPDHDDKLWADNSTQLLATDRNLNTAQTTYTNIRSDRVQTQIGIENANIAAWRRDHPELAARLDSLEQKAPQNGTVPVSWTGSNPGTPVSVTLAPEGSKWPAGTQLVRPPNLTNFIGPVSVDQLVPLDPNQVEINNILNSNEAQPLVAARQQIETLEGEQTQVKGLQRDLVVDREWLDKLQGMSPEDRADKGKRDELHLDFVRGHAQDFSDPAQELQRQLGGPYTGHDSATVRSLVQTMAGGMQQIGMPVDVDHVTTQILRAPQIHGDNPADVTIRPIAMQYQEAGVSTTTGVFEVTNGKGETFIVDLKGEIWDSKEDFLDGNSLYSHKGVLLMPKNLDTSGAGGDGIQYEALDARNQSVMEKWVDPVVGVITAVATIASFIPVINVVAAPIAIGGGLYLGGRAIYHQAQHVSHGGSWTDGESGMNMLGIVASAAPMFGSGFRMAGLAKSGIGLRSAARFSIGAAPRGAAYAERAQFLSRASVFRGQGLASMRFARVSDSVALSAGVPLLVMSTRDLANLDQMSGIQQTDALLNFFTGWFGTGMGYRGLRATRPARGETINVDDAPAVVPTTTSGQPRKWRLFFGGRGEQPLRTAADGGADPAVRVGDPAGIPADGQRAPALPADGGGSNPIHPALGPTPEGVRATPPLGEREIAANYAEAMAILENMTGELTYLNGVDALDVPNLARQASRSPILMEYLRIADRNQVRLVDGSTNPLQVLPDEHQNNRIHYAGSTETITLQSARPRGMALMMGAGPEYIAAELTNQLAHELAHASGWRRAQGLDVPFGMHGREAFETTYVNMRLEDEGYTRLAEMAVAEELHRNGGWIAPSLNLPESQGYVDLFHRFQAGEITWPEAVREAARQVGDNPDLPYRTEFEAEAARIWDGNPEIRRIYESLPGGRVVPPEGDTPAMMANPTPKGPGSHTPTVDQLRTMSTDDVGALTLEEVGGFTQAHTAALSNKQWAALAADQIAAIPEDAIPGIRPGRLARLRPDQTAAFTDRQLARMTEPQVQKMTLDQVGALPPDRIPAFVEHQAPHLRPAQIGRFSLDQLSRLTPAHITLFSEIQIAGLTRTQIAHLTVDQLSTFTPERIGWLKPDQISALTTEQVKSLSTRQVEALTSGQVRALTTDQIRALSTDQVGAFTTRQISALRGRQAAALSLDHIGAWSETQVGALRGEHITQMSADQIGAFSKKQVAALRPEAIGHLTADQLATFTPDRMGYLTAGQIAGLKPEQIGRLTVEQVAAIPADRLAGLTDLQLAAFSVEQLRAFTADQVAALRPEQRAALSEAQAAALDAPRLKGVRRGWNGLITEVRQNGLSYALLGLTSGVNGYLMNRFGILNPVSNAAFILRGTGFALQAAFPKTLGPNTKWAPRFAKFYAATFIPNIADGTIKMFKPDDFNPLVYVPYGIGSMPFAAQQIHYTIKGEPADSPRGNHVGYAGFTAGSFYYIPESFVPSPLGAWAGPASAIMFQGGSVMWVGAWIDHRQARRQMPGTGSTRLGHAVDNVLLDRFAPKYERFRPGIDRFANGVLYGGGLILFGAMGIAAMFESKADDKVIPDGGKKPGDTTPPDDTPPQLPPDEPGEPQPQPLYVIVQPWHAGDGSGDDSTLWHIAGDNIDTLLSPAQKAQAQREGLSYTDDRDQLVADWALPQLIELNPQYPLAGNPDLIHPGWRLNVGSSPARVS